MAIYEIKRAMQKEESFSIFFKKTEIFLLIRQKRKSNRNNTNRMRMFFKKSDKIPMLIKIRLKRFFKIVFRFIYLSLFK
jgi:hypothetical protein